MELLVFTAMLRQDSARKILMEFGLSFPNRLDFIAHTQPHDPPDITAFNLGIEVTEFPPDESARRAIRNQPDIPGGTRVPAFQHAGRDYRKIRSEIADPESKTNSPYQFPTRQGEVEALTREFSHVLKAKDISVNHVLILDHRDDPNIDRTLEAVQEVTRKERPKHLKLIVVVGSESSVQAYRV